MFLRFNFDKKYRHYKKDSRFVMDLYTITYDTHDKLENLPEIHDIHKRRSSREEIRRKLANGEGIEAPRPTPKFNLGFNGNKGSSSALQVCYMNETASDGEEDPLHPSHFAPQSLPFFKPFSPQAVPPGGKRNDDEDFFKQQVSLEAEARSALQEAKELARLQLTQERALRAHSPVSEMVRMSLRKANRNLEKEISDREGRLGSRQLKGLSTPQLTVVVEELHAHIERLNETLVSMLVERDDLHMEQDAMLVDIEDLTRYLSAKHSSDHQSLPLISARQTILGKK